MAGKQRSRRTKVACALFLLVVGIINAAAQQTDASPDAQGSSAVEGSPSPAPQTDTSSSHPAPSTLSEACKDRLQKLQFSSNLPLVLIQLQNVNQVAGATAAQLQLLAKGMHSSWGLL
jgi:hypothetical protein